MNSKKGIDLGSTQKIHRRNLSMLIKTTGDADGGKNFVVSTKTHERRTLEEIEQGSTFAYGDESQEEMTSQDSALNNSPNLNSNQKQSQEPAIPQDGFYNMVEQPSAFIEDGDENMESGSQGVQVEDQEQVMEFPNSSKTNSQTNDPSNTTPPTKAPRSNKRTGFSFSNVKTPQQDGTASRGELISQATNESCSSGFDEEEDRGAAGNAGAGSPTTPYESYAQQRSLSKSKGDDKAGPGAFQYYQDSSQSNNGQEDPSTKQMAPCRQYVDVSDDAEYEPEYLEDEKDSESSKKQYIDESSPETWKNSKPTGQKLNFGKGLQIEIDSDQDDVVEIVQPAPRGKGKELHHSQLIQFEEQDESQDDGDMDLYQGLNTAPAHSQSQYRPNQKQNYINEQSKEGKADRQKPHTTKNTNESVQQFVRPGVDDVNQNAFSQEQMQRTQGIRQGQTSEEVSSVSISAQVKSNGQIRFGQQSSSRVSDRIYEKAHGMSPPNLNDFSPSDNSSATHGRRSQINLTGEFNKQQSRQRQQWQKTHQTYPMQDQQLQPQRPEEGTHRTITSEDSDELASRLRREDAMEYEIRRLEDLNQIEAQRLKEAVTTDESQQNQHSAQDGMEGNEIEEDLNLLEGTASLSHISPPKALEDSKGVQSPAGPHASNLPPEVYITSLNSVEDINERDSDFMYDQLVENKVMTDGEHTNGSDAMNSGRQQVVSPTYVDGSLESEGRHSRKLYVITEESQSYIGPAMSVDDFNKPSFRNQLNSNQKPASSSEKKSKQDKSIEQQPMQRISLVSFPNNEINNSATLAARSAGSSNQVDFEKNANMNNTVGNKSSSTQGFNDYLRNINQQNESDTVKIDDIPGPASQPNSHANSAHSSKGIYAYNSNPNTFKHQSQHEGQLNNMILDQNPVVVQKFTQSVSEYKAIRNTSLRSSQEAPNPAGCSQKGIAFKENGDMASIYLRQTSAASAAKMGDSERGKALLSNANGQQPFELISDEDLLGSNFDRISKIVPNHEILPDFNCGDSISPPRRGTDTTDGNHKIMALMNEINQLQQVIKIKDNTILQMQEQTVVEHSKLYTDVGSLARPDTIDAKCQTIGPKKKAYYDSIPAKINTNLKERERAQSDDQFEYRGHTKIVKYKSVADKKVSPEPTSRKAKDSATGSFISPKKYISPESAMEQGIHKEDAKSLRVQLQLLKAQLNDQEADNLTLIEKVTSLEAAIQEYEQMHGEFVHKLRQKVFEKNQLEEQVEEMTKCIDSLRADNVELKQLTMLHDMQVQEVMNNHSDLKERTHKSRLDVGKNDCQVQTDNTLWNEFLISQSQKWQQHSDDVLGSTTSPMQPHTQPIISHQQTMINTLLEQLAAEQEVSGEQGNSKEIERINQLIERANNYEHQYQNIEQEIIEYKKALHQQQIQQENQAISLQYQQMNNQHVTIDSALAPQIEKSVQQHSRVQSASTPMNNMHLNVQQIPNLIDYINSAGSEQNLNSSLIQGTNQGQTLNYGIENFMSNQHQNLNATGQSNPLIQEQNHANSQQQSWLNEQYTHYKRKAKKLEKKNQKLEFEKVTNHKLMQEFQLKQQEMNEKYRDLRQKFQMKLHEKNIKISELKTTINQLQLFAPQQYQQQMSQLTTNQLTSSNNLTAMNSNPNMNIVDKLSEQTLRHHTHDSIQDITTQMQGMNLTQQNVINERQRIPRPQQQSRNGKVHHTKTSSVENLGISNVSAVDKSALGVSVMTSPGEIYHMISGIVDQKIAEEQTRKNQFNSNNQSMHEKQINLQHPSGQQTTGTTAKARSSAQQQMEGHQQRYLRSPEIVSHEFQLQKSAQNSTGSLQRQVNEFYQPTVHNLSPGQQYQSSPTEQELLFTQTHDIQQTGQTVVSSPFQQQQQNNFMLHDDQENINQNLHEWGNHDSDSHHKQKSSKNQEHSRLSHYNQSRNQAQPQVNQTHSPNREAQQMLSFYMDQNAQMLASFDPTKQKEIGASMLSSIKSTKKKESLAQSFIKSKTGRTKSKRDSQQKSTKRNHSSPTHRPRSMSRKSSERRPQYMDNSVKSAISKDDVMPCYKSRFEGKKRVDVQHQTKPLPIGFLEPRTLREQATDASDRIFSVRYQGNNEQAQPRVRTQEGPASLHHYQQHDSTADGKITQMLNLHYTEFMQPQQQDLQQQIEWLRQQNLSSAASYQRSETDPVIDIYQRPRYTN